MWLRNWYYGSDTAPQGERCHVTFAWDLVTDLYLITESNFLPTLVTAVPCQQRALTTPDTLHVFLFLDQYVTNLSCVQTFSFSLFSLEHPSIRQNRSTEGCSKLKTLQTRQVQERMVSTLEHTQVPKWDRTRCPGVSVICWHAAPVVNVLWKPHN